jgi:glycosyltransferase involved in cell wall biosynthesis
VNDEKLVSVIVPAFNRLAWLAECIRSIDAQTYPAIELIVVDGASDDDVAGLISQIAWRRDPPIQIFRSDIRHGPGASREMGRQAAKGSYICYLDSDDIWMPEKVALQVAALETDEQAGMCTCICKVFSVLPLTGEEPVWLTSDQGHRSILPIVLQQRPWCTSACMWTRKAADAIGPWLPLIGGEDIAYELYAGAVDIQVAFVPQVLCLYRRQPGGEHLSFMEVIGLAVQQALALLYSQSILSEHSKLEDMATAHALAWNFFSTSNNLLAVGQDRLARVCLNAAVDLTSGRTLLGGSARMVRWLSRQRLDHAAGLSSRLFRRINRRPGVRYVSR